MSAAARDERSKPMQAESDLDRLLAIGGQNYINREAAQNFIIELAERGVPWADIHHRLLSAVLLHGRTHTTATWYADPVRVGEFVDEEVSFQRGQKRWRVGGNGATALDLAEFLKVEFPPKENIVDPVFPRQGLGMVHAWRGLGKTYFALFFAFTVATGGRFLKWKVDRAWRVLYVDGEMRGVDMQVRLSEIVRASERHPEPGVFKIITPDLQGGVIPDLATPEGQDWLDAVIADRDLIVLDNLSSLIRRSGSENADELWLPLQGWMQRQRAVGRSVLLIHHDGKNETQRGPSKHEDILDTVFHLKKPSDYREQDGARFVIHFPKHRGFYGKDCEPFEVALTTNEQGLLEWTMRDLEEALTVQVASMLTAGCTVTQISNELKIGRATVDRHKKKAIERGLYHGK
jgi:hypothetical protein